MSLYGNNIQEQKWSLMERFGRDLRIPATALNHPEITKSLKAYLERFLSLLISRPYADSPTSVVNFERVMEGTRSLAK
ncbi:MAG: hypothetical protein JOZ45_15485 [Acidobacteriaceae bacterium]|nr:hypothetical protein [Acidobacteriaceae bacterium]MBV9307547.1 hypothetical protein [Acidobacteriaceae bacterium]